MSDCTIGNISKKSRKTPDDECGAVQDPVTKFGLDFENHLDVTWRNLPEYRKAHCGERQRENPKENLQQLRWQ